VESWRIRSFGERTSCSQAGDNWEERIKGPSTTKLCEIYKDWPQKLLCFMLLGSFLRLSPWSHRFAFLRILRQPGLMYLLYLSPVMIQLTEILELGTRPSRNASSRCLSMDNIQHSCPPFTCPPSCVPGPASNLLQHRCIQGERFLQLEMCSRGYFMKESEKKTLQWVHAMLSSIE